MPDPRVSRRHLLLSPTPGGWRWRDLGSKNGTRRLDAAPDAPLVGVAWLSLGTVLLRAETAPAASAAPASPEDVLADLLPLTGALGVSAWAGPRDGPPALVVGDAGAGPGRSLTPGPFTVVLHGPAGAAPLSEVEHGLACAITRQALLLARAAEAREALGTGLR